MAITPYDADCLVEKEALQSKAFEKTIDAYLKENYIPGKDVSVTVYTDNYRILNELVKVYKEAGWDSVTFKVSGGSYNRDGDSYSTMIFSSSKKKEKASFKHNPMDQQNSYNGHYVDCTCFQCTR